MAYTASALSFMLQNLDKPVIITGSQLPIGEVRTDGEENLITALQVAAAKDCQGNHVVREVAILFENYLWRGNRSTKYSADNFNAFKSNNYPQLAKIGLGIQYNKEALWRKEVCGPLKVHYEMDTNVFILDLFPGITETTVRHLLATPHVKGIVMKSFGAVNSGIVIVNITQCSNGCVHPMRYLTGWELSRAGVVCGHDMTTEAAITKLMYLFGKGLSNDEVRRYLEMSLRGEMSLPEE